MKPFPHSALGRILAVALLILALGVMTEGCSKSKSKDYPFLPPTGTGSGTGTGTFTGTGVGIGIELLCVYDPGLGAQTSHKQAFGEIVREVSGYVWTGTKNQVYISRATIRDGTSGDVIILNLNEYQVYLPGTGWVYGYTGGSTMYVGGACLTLTFQHELGHAKMNLADHYGTTITCIMNASAGGAYMMQRNYCEGGAYDCWGSVVSQYGISPTGSTGSVPPTEIIIQ